MKKAWLLARVSTVKASQDQSPEGQLSALRAYVERQGWVVAGDGVERASGGKGESERPRLAEALVAARSGRVDVIAVTHLDRLGRDLANLLDVSAELERLGVGLVILSLNVDTTTAMGRLVYSILGAVAEFQLRHYADRAQLGKARAAAKGVHCARPPEVVPNHTVLAAVARLCEVPGLSWRALSLQLGQDPLHRQPGRWIKSTGTLREERCWPATSLRRAVERYRLNQKPPSK